MPFIIPVSVKVALGVGALTGAVIATVNNKEKVWEATEFVFRKGAEYCRHKLEEAKSAKDNFAVTHDDGAFAFSQTGFMAEEVSDSGEYETDEATTPSISDFSDVEEYLDLESLD